MGLAGTGFALLAMGLVLDLVARARTPRLRVAPLVIATVASVMFAIQGALALDGRSGWSSLTWLFGGSGPAAASGLSLDPLAGLFLVIVFALAVPGLLVVAAWAWDPPAGRPKPPNGLSASLCLLLAACAGVILAGDAFTLTLSWELLTAAFYWLTTPGRRGAPRHGAMTASISTVGFGKVSGAALLLGVLLLAADGSSLRLADLGGGHGVARDTAYGLLVLAFAIKVGLAPVEIWLPRGYAAASGPARALMAGVAVNAGFYGLWRTLQMLGAPPGWLVVVLLLLGGLTALLGIAHATVQTRLTAVVAYSSVENAGLIVTSYAVALLGAVTGKPQLVAAGLLAATLQVVAHAVGKTLLFAAAGTIESRLGTDDMDQLRGVAHELPWSGTALAVGAVTMAGLPPTVLFVSEWFILETLMQQFRVGALVYTLPMAAAGALVALTSGFAGVAFTRLAAFTALGRRGAARAHELGVVGRIGFGALMIACVGVAALTPLEIRLISTGLGQVVPAAVTASAVASPWVVGPVYPGFSALSPSWLVIELPAVLAIVLGATALLSHGRLRRVRRVDPWRSATGGVEGVDQYTPFGYSNATRKVLANVLLTRTELRALERASGGQLGDEQGPAAAHLGYTSDVVQLSERFLYRPVLGPLRRLVSAARRLQSGRLDAYIFYMLVALVAALVVAVS